MTKTDTGWGVVLALAAPLLVEPTLREGPVQWAFMLTLGAMFALMLARDYREGCLRRPLRDLMRSPPRVRPMEFLGSMVGIIALMLPAP